VGKSKCSAEENFYFYFSPQTYRHIIRMIISSKLRLASYAVRMGEMRNANKMFVGKPEGKITLGRRKHG
jgi:hypothetical protein